MSVAMADPVRPMCGTSAMFSATFTAAAASVITAARPVFPSLVGARTLDRNCP